MVEKQLPTEQSSRVATIVFFIARLLVVTNVILGLAVAAVAVVVTMEF